ncbi:MAG TPA: hypothetical protein VIV11_34910 [Kofleriaceae bacterium]
MRLEILNSGHAFKMKALFTVMRLLSRQRVPDVIKTLTYRPDFFGNPLNECFQETMRGKSEWSVGDRELMAAFVSKVNECEF